MIGAHVGNWEIGAPFFDEYGKKINIVMFDAEHEADKGDSGKERLHARLQNNSRE